LYVDLPAAPGVVCVSTSPDPLIEWIGDQVVAELLARGTRAARVSDGDELPSNTSQLWLLGRACSFAKFAARFKGRSDGARPHVVLWQFFPLPPPLFSERAEKLAEGLDRGQLGDLFGNWAASLDRWIQPRGRMKTAIRRLVGLQLQNELGRLGGPDYGEIGLGEMQRMLDEARWIQEHAGAAGWIDRVAVTCPGRVTYLSLRRIAAEYVPFGYVPDAFEAGATNTTEKQRDVDVLFTGQGSSFLRHEVLPQLPSQLKRWGYTARHLTGEEPAANQLDVLSRTRILLHIPCCPWDNSAPRLTLAVANGALVLSTARGAIGPLRAEDHVVTRTLDSICATLTTFLDCESYRYEHAQRRRLALQGERTLEKAVSRLLSMLSTRSPQLPRGSAFMTRR
jgi:hypothetical protein